MKEKGEMLAQQAKSAGVQGGSEPTIELVTPTAGRERGSSGIICGPMGQDQVEITDLEILC